MDRTRREALNRAKREPFVIYMMSILTPVSMNRAGFDIELRDRIGAAWKAEDYHEAGKLIPDEMLDAFMLCGTREDVAEKAMDSTPRRASTCRCSSRWSRNGTRSSS